MSEYQLVCGQELLSIVRKTVPKTVGVQEEMQVGERVPGD